MGLQELHPATLSITMTHAQAQLLLQIHPVFCKRLSQTPRHLCLSFEALMDFLIVSQVSYAQPLQLKHPASIAPKS